MNNENIISFKFPGFLKLKFSILQVTFWCSFGSFTSFAIAYMIQKGLSASLIGMMLAAYTFCALFGQFFWGFISDKLRTNKKIFILTNLLMLGTYYLVYFISGNFLIVLAYGLLGFIQTPIICNLDTWILKSYHETPEEYGPIRSWASLSYALFMFFYGSIIHYASYSVMLIFSSVFVAMTIICALTTPDAPLFKMPETLKEVSRSSSIQNLITNRNFIYILLILFLIGFASIPVMQMLPIILKNVQGTVVHQGYAMFASSIAQVPFMLFSRKLTRFSAYNRLLFSACMYFVSIIMMAFAKSPELIILLCAVNGIGFGIQLPSMRQLVFENSAQGFHNTAQGLSDAVNSSLAGMVSSAMAGFLIDGYGVAQMLIFNAAVQFIVIALLFRRFILVNPGNFKKFKIIQGE